MSTIRKAIFIVAFASLSWVGLPTAADADLCHTNYFIELYNVDDEAHLYLNDQPILTQYFNESKEIDLSFNPNYKCGVNILRLVVVNNGLGWAYGWRIKRKDSWIPGSAYVIYNHQCGSAGKMGCENNEQGTDVVFTETFRINNE